MKNLMTRLAMLLGAATMPATAGLMAQANGQSVAEVCKNPANVELGQKLWDYVQSQDKTEVYIAFLKECGDAPMMAQFVKLAREVVIERTSNFTVMPKQVFMFSPVKDDNFKAHYVY